jgi:hypothetical protein
VTEDIDQLVAEITVDSYNEDEALPGFEAAFDDEVRFPLSGAVLGEQVQAASVGLRDGRRELIATCERAGDVTTSPFSMSTCPERCRHAVGRRISPVARAVRRSPVKVWDLLSDAEHALVLRRLVQTHPELVDEVEEVAAVVLAEVERSEVAGEVAGAVESVSTAATDLAELSHCLIDAICERNDLLEAGKGEQTANLGGARRHSDMAAALANAADAPDQGIQAGGVHEHHVGEIDHGLGRRRHACQDLPQVRRSERVELAYETVDSAVGTSLLGNL